MSDQLRDTGSKDVPESGSTESATRPDKHPELIVLGASAATCVRCTKLFPTASDSICNDCALNPNTDENDGLEAFVADLFN